MYMNLQTMVLLLFSLLTYKEHDARQKRRHIQDDMEK